MLSHARVLCHDDSSINIILIIIIIISGLCVFCRVDATGPDGLQGATFSVLLMAWTSVIKGFVCIFSFIQ